MNQKEIIDLPAGKMEELQTSKTTEGIYYFKFDTAYKIAVVKSKYPLTDYMGIIISSKLPTWKKGMIKFEARHIEDSLLKGVLYMRNHLPKEEWFSLGKNIIGGDWQREGTLPEPFISNYVPVASKKLTGKTLYIKISSFSPSNGKNIDSVFNVNKALLDTMPNLVLDIRGNGGGSDFTFHPILPYIYTNPVKDYGVDVLATEANIDGWKKILDDPDLSAENKQAILDIIKKMEANKDRLVSLGNDGIDSSFSALPYPRKIVILIDKGCASTTEQFLLAAKQSKKVILMGEHTNGTLDYSNVRQAKFSCMPYTLRYSTTRSHRVDINQGIDNKGINPIVI